MEHNPTTHSPEKRRFSILGLFFKIALAYLVLVFGGGTLVQTGNPTAVEVGRFMHMVTLVNPTISWADANGYKAVAKGLRGLSEGVPLGRGT
jgi:hypothetical protein